MIAQYKGLCHKCGCWHIEPGTPIERTDDDAGWQAVGCTDSLPGVAPSAHHIQGQARKDASNEFRQAAAECERAITNRVGTYITPSEKAEIEMRRYAEHPDKTLAAWVGKEEFY